ncbi:MarR family winged helix-turn-helix transcriptional regulator [Acrocarpospora macrocephala]|nr:MarR family transcriptional regulator [Acrocarpospora macrocephala]
MSEPAEGELTSRDLLRVYLDAVTLIEPFQYELEQRANITLVQARMLRRLRHGPRTQTQLGQGMGLSPSSVSRLVDRLVAEGLVVRGRSGGDARQILVRVTPKGQSLFATMRVLQGTVIERAAADMPGDRRRLLHETLREFVDRVKAYGEI